MAQVALISKPFLSQPASAETLYCACDCVISLLSRYANIIMNLIAPTWQGKVGKTMPLGKKSASNVSFFNSKCEFCSLEIFQLKYNSTVVVFAYNPSYDGNSMSFTQYMMKKFLVSQLGNLVLSNQLSISDKCLTYTKRTIFVEPLGYFNSCQFQTKIYNTFICQFLIRIHR